MTHDEFDKLFEAQVERSRSVLVQKSKEYSTEDKLHNFKVAAAVQGSTPLKALAGMMAKHTVSLYDLFRSDVPVDPALFDEKLTDHINYLFLAKALFEETLPTYGIDAEHNAVSFIGEPPYAFVLSSWYKDLLNNRTFTTPGNITDV